MRLPSLVKMKQNFLSPEAIDSIITIKITIF